MYEMYVKTIVQNIKYKTPPDSDSRDVRYNNLIEYKIYNNPKQDVRDVR